MKHVVLGAGPVGISTSRALAARGVDVHVVSRTPPKALPVGVRHHALDVRDEDALARASADGAVIYQCLNAPYHRWSEDFPPLQRAAVTAARRSRARLVSFENLYVYGRPGSAPFTEGSALAPCSEKGRVRASMALELDGLAARGELDVSHVRASNLFGPRMRDSALGGEMIGRAVEGRAPRLLGDPDALHTWTFTRDAGETLAAVGLAPATTRSVWHVPSAPPCSQNDVVARLSRLLGVTYVGRPTPAFVLRLMGLVWPAAGEVVEMLYEFRAPFLVADEAARVELGVTHTPFDDALRETVEAFLRDRPRQVAAGQKTNSTQNSLPK